MPVMTLNGANLKKIFQTNETAKIVLEALSGRQRERTFVDIVRFRCKLMHEGKMIIDQDYQKVWQDLQKANIGTIIVGRRGGANRFNLHYSLKAIAKTAKEGRNAEVERIKGTAKTILKKAVPVAAVAARVAQVAEPKVVTAPTAVSVIPEKIVLIPFRGRSIGINLPGDVTKEEVTTIASTLSTMLG